MSQIYDVIIIGAGPAGLSAALNLAGTGLSVLVVDKHSFPREKVCGDALSGSVMNVMKRFPGDVYRDFLEFPAKTPSYGIRFIAPDRHYIDVPFSLADSPGSPAPGFLCKRIDFDEFLFSRLQRYPEITVLNDFRVIHAHLENDGIVVSDSKQEKKARVVVGADGMHSVIATSFGTARNEPDQFCLAVRMYFKNVTDMHPDGFIELHFLRKLLPGYLWIFPLSGNEVNAGLGMMVKKVKKKRLNLSQLLMDMIDESPDLKRRFAGATASGKPGGYGLPLGPVKGRLSGNRYLLAGDAASLVDPFSGEGIGNAMISGEIAARVIKGAFAKEDFSARFLRSYDQIIRRSIGRELRISRRIRQLAGIPWLFNRVVRKAEKNEEMRTLLTKMYSDQEVKSELLNPLFYLKLFSK